MSATPPSLVCPRCAHRGPGPRCPRDGAWLVTDQAWQEAPRDALLGAFIADRYAITRRIGVGGMGAVYEGQDLHQQRVLALKFLRPRYAGHPALRQRFVREAEAAASVKSPYVVPLLDFGVEPDGTLWMAMEFVRGWTVRDEVNRRGALEVDVAIRLTRQVLLGLEAIHAAGLVHRDLKHDNIMFVGDRQRFTARILDFGVVKSAIAEVEARDGHGLHTATGVLVGSPSYMAPEQIRGLKVGPPADLYALAVILWEALVAQRLFTAQDYETLRRKGARRDAPALIDTARGEAVPPGFARVIERALRHDPADRFPDARTMLMALEQIDRLPDPLPEDLLADPGPTELLLSAPTPPPAPPVAGAETPVAEAPAAAGYPWSIKLAGFAVGLAVGWGVAAALWGWLG